MRNNYLYLLLVIVFFMTACNSAASNDNEDSAVTGQESNGTESEEEVTISFIHWRGEDTEAFNELITAFEEENPSINVEMNVYPSEQYQTNAQTLLRDGSTGDVFTSFPGSQFQALAGADLFTDLTGEEFLSNFNSSLIEAGQKDGKQLAVPYQLVFNQPVYNVSIFESLNLEPPSDWEGFIEVGHVLKENGYIPIAFPGADIGPGQFMNSMVMNNAPDEEIFEKVILGDEKVTNEWWVKTLKQIKELQDLGFFQEDALATQHPGAIALVAQEKAAMLASGSFAMGGIREQNPEIQLQLLAPITVNETEAIFEGIHTTTFMLAVNKNSKHPEEAKLFINFLSSQQYASLYANKTGQHLTVNDVEYESDILQETAHWMDKNTRFQPRFHITNAEVERALLSSIQDVISGTDPVEAAESAQRIIDQQIN